MNRRGRIGPAVEGLGTHSADLQAATDGEPKEFRDALKRVVRAAITEGAARLPPSRTHAELRTMFDVWNKLEALDAKALFEKMGLKDHLTQQRANGLASMMARIRTDATAALQTASSSKYSIQ